MISLAVEEFYPYIIRCFQAVFKSSSVSLVFGRPSLASDNTTSVYSLDIDRINEPLSEYLPEKIAVDQGVVVDMKSNFDDEISKAARTTHNDDEFSNVSIQGSTKDLLKTISSGSINEKTAKASEVLNLEQRLESQLNINETNVVND